LRVIGTTLIIDRRTLYVTRICIGSKQKPRDIAPGVFLLDQTLIDYAAIAFFLRQPS